LNQNRSRTPTAIQTHAANIIKTSNAFVTNSTRIELNFRNSAETKNVCRICNIMFIQYNYMYEVFDANYPARRQHQLSTPEA
jgi:hypothetical protein